MLSHHRLSSIAAVAFIIGLGCTHAFAANREQPTEPDYTKGETVAGGEWKHKTNTHNLGPIGVRALFWSAGAHELTDTTRTARIVEVMEGTPADGALKVGDVLLGVRSPRIPPYRDNLWIPASEPAIAQKDYIEATTFSYDIRKSLAVAITEAEKKENGGKLVLNIWREGKTMPVVVKLPVIGSYSRTYPWDCGKTDALITMMADRAVDKGLGRGGIHTCLLALGLVATGEEKYITVVRDWVRNEPYFKPDVKLDLNKSSSWNWAYQGIFLAEYYMATKDEYVLPILNEYANKIALGQSGAGTWSHGMSAPKDNYGRLHGIPASYGAMNQVSLTCNIALVLAQKAGIHNDEIDAAVKLNLDFYRYFVDRGVIPYGDHAPGHKTYENNGVMSQAAVLFDLAGDKKSAAYFNRMALSSYHYREHGHTGHFFSRVWGAPGTARAGEEAAQSFMQNIQWFLELERRPNHDYVYQPQLHYGHFKTGNWNTAGPRLLALCLPRKQLYITGKGGCNIDPVKGDELMRIVELANVHPGPEHSVDQLLKFLESESPILRNDAASELGNRKDDDVVDRLVGMLLNSKNRFARYGACNGLNRAGRGSEKAVDALINTIETTDDPIMKYHAALAFRDSWQPKDIKLGAGPAIRKAIPTLLKLMATDDPTDPRKKLHAELAVVMFYKGSVRGHTGLLTRPKDLAGVDRKLLIPAIQSVLTNPNGDARSCLANALYSNLPEEDLELIWRDIYLAALEPAPSGVMFGGGVVTKGLELMEQHDFDDALTLGMITIRREGWGKWNRMNGSIPVVAKYGPIAKPYQPEFVPWVEEQIAKLKKDVEKFTQKEGKPRDGTLRKLKQMEELLEQARAIPEEPRKLKSISTYLEKEDLQATQKLLELSKQDFSE